jgi:carbon storage regulator
MLVLSRHIGEEIVIDGEIRVMVVGVQGKTVRLGVAAPPAIPVYRKEIHERCLKEMAGEPVMRYRPAPMHANRRRVLAGR